MNDSLRQPGRLTDPLKRLTSMRALGRAHERVVSFLTNRFEFGSKRIEFIPKSRFDGRSTQLGEIKFEKNGLDCGGGFDGSIKHGATIPVTARPQPADRRVEFVGSERCRKDDRCRWAGDVAERKGTGQSSVR